MAINEKLENKIRTILVSQLLDEETLEYDTPWGEDGALYAFEQGQKFGAHYLAEEILKLLNKANK